jgi:hypothetical protein
VGIGIVLTRNSNPPAVEPIEQPQEQVEPPSEVMDSGMNTMKRRAEEAQASER